MSLYRNEQFNYFILCYFDDVPFPKNFYVWIFFLHDFLRATHFQLIRTQKPIKKLFTLPRSNFVLNRRSKTLLRLQFIHLGRKLENE